MSGIYTFTVEPTPTDLAWGLIRHADFLAMLAFLAGLLFTSMLLEEPP